jgi:AraC-like DNA-binding protein
VIWGEAVKKITFSTDVLSPGLDEWKRRTLWHDRYAEVIGPCDVSYLPDKPLAVEFGYLPIGEIGVGEYCGTMGAISRSSRQAAEISDPFYHLTYNSGPADWSYDISKRDTLFPPGALMLFDPIGPSRLQTNDAACFRGVQVPKRLLQSCIPDADDLVCRLAPDTPAARLLKGYVDLLCTDEQFGDDPALATHIDTVLLDLAVLALGAARDAADVARMRGMRAARLQEIIARIRARFADPAFSTDQVALELGLSRRYVNDLLQETGQSFTERVLELRLQKARSMLAEPRHDRLKVSDVALACGFNEVSYFNRCFRRRFGASPTESRGANGDAVD